jgi:hypothetical protein
VAKKEGDVAKVENSEEKCKFAGEKKMYHEATGGNLARGSVDLEST